MRILQILTGALVLSLQAPAQAHIPHFSGDVSVEIVTDNGRVLPVYPLRSRKDNSYRAYLEALRGRNYGIKIYNRSGRRVGVVIAVDGRNIISGRKSYLRSSEQMYILGPYERNSFNGWRTSREKIHRFYFTQAGDSYAGAWDDYSAMGVIAVAVFPEKISYPPHPLERSGKHRGRSPAEGVLPKAPAASRENKARVLADTMEPGTGFGDEQNSRVHMVHFDPVATASSRYFFKYEWRETLCKKRIIDCASHIPNRFWPEGGEFAPFPPG